MKSWTRLVAALLLCPHSAAIALDDATKAMQSIRSGGIRAHMEALSTDAMEGRETGTPGFERAARYVADTFAKIGIPPLSATGYDQPIDFFETRLVPASAQLSLQRDGKQIQLNFRDDFIRGGGFGTAAESVTADLVFVGHGIIAPEYEHDDYAGIDARGKILVVLSGAPPHFATDQRAFYSSSSGKAALAVTRGAVGILTVRTPVDEKRRPWERLLPGIGAPAMRWQDANGRPFDAHPELVGDATLSRAGAQQLFDLANRDLAAIFAAHAGGATGSFALGVRASLARTSKQRTARSMNVVGVLRGSDPQLATEYVVFTAHLDHLGIRPSEDGDTIHNGAYDNAASVAAMLEIAAAMRTLPVPPKRSVIFAALTAEEMGQQGSSYFVENPPVPIERIVANINIDMPYFAYPIADIEAFGADHSTLYAALEKATAQVGVALSPDSKPEEVRFIRSDQFSFVKRGIPAVALKPGQRSSDPQYDGAAMLSEFLSRHYHRSSDEIDLPYSPEGAERFVRTGFLTVCLVADEVARPQWNPGDFFGTKFRR